MGATQGDVSAAKTADGLTPWQLHKVQHAAAIGRRKVKVIQRCQPISVYVCMHSIVSLHNYITFLVR